MPEPQPLFRIVYAETGEPVPEPPEGLGSYERMAYPFYTIDAHGNVWVKRWDSRCAHTAPWLRVEWLLDPQTGLPPRRKGV